MIDAEMKIILTAKARSMGVSVETIKQVIAARIVNGETEEDPVSMVLSIDDRDLKCLQREMKD
ncbi:hypothetical protein LRP49_17435 [Enterovibrio sp. ZSDZ35]|uniref:Uncharacterized protein n=1 Tax=Enterovibrio qingdaonensis TaxID=2899818 RepID=A0ABT5QQI3_9GAMM|nr:hypothetical protein [Enterovibrio sp. ZSDZ35]MDD1782958.1 hypothetical protein [Enterovibrio sp. ZSDZ35]